MEKTTLEETEESKEDRVLLMRTPACPKFIERSKGEIDERES